MAKVSKQTLADIYEIVDRIASPSGATLPDAKRVSLESHLTPRHVSFALTELSERGALVRVVKGPRRWVFDTTDGEPNALECELLEMIYGADFENVTT